MANQTTNTMKRLLEVMEHPERHSNATATRWALHVVVASATHIGYEAAGTAPGIASYDAVIAAGRALAKEYSELVEAR